MLKELPTDFGRGNSSLCSPGTNWRRTLRAPIEFAAAAASMLLSSRCLEVAIAMPKHHAARHASINDVGFINLNLINYVRLRYRFQNCQEHALCFCCYGTASYPRVGDM